MLRGHIKSVRFNHATKAALARTPFDSIAAAMPGCGASISLHPDWGPEEIREALRETAVDLGDPGRDDYYGYGLVDAEAAVSYNISP